MIGLILPISIALPAILLWIIEKPLKLRFINNIVTFTSFGQILGLVGICLFVYVIFFSTRPKFLEEKFGGLDKIYKSHHQIGVASWIILLLHPLVLSFAQIRFSIARVINYFVPGRDLFVNLGIFALFMMILLLVLTLFFRPTFKIWKITHKFLTLALLLGALHSLLIGSDISRFVPLKIYMFIIISIGLISALYQIFLSNKLKKKYEFRVKALTIKNTIADITLSPKEKTFTYKPGQFIFVKFISKNIPKESHPFSIAPGGENDIRIIVKLQGDYTNLLEKLKVGEKAIVEGPYGRFYRDEYAENKQIWVAGGIGIVPFLSMLKNVARGLEVDIYYLVKNESEAIYLSELMLCSKGNNKIKVIPYYSETMGHITPQKISDISGDFTKSEFYICGPKRMTQLFADSLKNKGVINNKIHFELFEY